MADQEYEPEVGGDISDHNIQSKDQMDDENANKSVEKPFVCDVKGCGTGFARKKSLAKHQLRVHSEELIPDLDLIATFCCMFCPLNKANKFDTQTELKLHFLENHRKQFEEVKKFVAQIQL